MRENYKKVGYAVAAIFFLIAFSGCTKKPLSSLGGQTTRPFIIWGFDDENVWQPVVSRLSAEHRVSVIYQKKTLNEDYENKSLNSILAGDGPDIWAMPNDWIYRHKEKLTPMPAEYLKKFSIDQYVSGVTTSAVINNQIYALSPSFDPLLLVYNPDILSKTLDDFNLANEGEENNLKRDRMNQLFAEFSKTWDNIVEVNKMVTKKNGPTIERAGLAIGTDDIEHSQDILYLLMLQAKTKMLSDDLKIATFSLPIQQSGESSDTPGRKALDFYASFANPKSSNYSWNDSLGNNIDAFGREKAAMVFAYSSTINDMVSRYPNLKYKKAFVPQRSRVVGQKAEELIDYGRFISYGVNKYSINPETSWSILLDIVNGSPGGFGLPTPVKIPDTPSLEARVGETPEGLTSLTAKTFLKGRFPTQYDSFVREAIKEVNSGQDSKTALDVAALKATELLKKSDW